MNPPKPDTHLSDWLGLADPDSSATGTDSWWALPSSNHPRIYVSTHPAAWNASLGLINSPRKRLLTRGLLTAKSLLRTPPQWHGRACSPLRDWLSELFPGRGPFRFAVYVGTPSIYVKDTIQCLAADGKTLAFLKVPRGPAASRVIHHEAEILSSLATRFPGGTFFPAILGRRCGQFLQAPPPPALASQPANPASILARLLDQWSESFTWAESPVRQAVTESLPAIRSSDAPDWAVLLASACGALEHHFGDRPVPHPMSHGDFIRWNILPGPFAFDWEWAAHRLPWHDAFHYLWMPAIQRGRPLGFKRLWAAWMGPEGAALRSAPTRPDPQPTLGVAYLTCQLAFYASSAAENPKSIRSIPVLATLGNLLEQALGELN